MAEETSAPELSELADRAARSVREIAEVAVGLGILGVNRVQALRREAARRLAAEREGGDPVAAGSTAEDAD
jgi:hypothetical protein